MKISGFRIEIGEIENRLLQVPGVRDGAVVTAGTAERPYLVGYYTGAADVGPEVVREALAGVLPGYMVPQHLHHGTELPLTANGKIDKKALARMAAEAEQTAGSTGFGLRRPLPNGGSPRCGPASSRCRWSASAAVRGSPTSAAPR